jgi:hypothetical protein
MARWVELTKGGEDEVLGHMPQWENKYGYNTVNLVVLPDGKGKARGIPRAFWQW